MSAQPTDALNVLIQALPSEQASTLVKQFNLGTQSTTSTTGSATSQPSLSLATALSSSHSSNTALSASSSTLITSYTTSSTSTTSSSTSTGNSATAVPASSAQALSPGEIAGIVTGSIAGVAIILILLLCLFLIRKRAGHRRTVSETSLLGSIAGSVSRQKKNKVFPEVAWLYDPVKPGSRDMSVRPSNEGIPNLGANLPWSSRPSTSLEHEANLRALPRDGRVELPAIPIARAIDPSFLEPGHEDNPRRFSYPLRPSATPDEDAADEIISPLLPPPPPPMSFSAPDVQEQVGSRWASSYGSARVTNLMASRTAGIRGPPGTPSPDSRPPTRHGPVHAL